MVDPDKIRKRAQAATEKATESLQKSIEDSNQQIEQMREKLKASAEPDDAVQDGTAQSAVDAQRQVELLGQMFSTEMLQQISVTEEMLQQTVDQKVAGILNMNVKIHVVPWHKAGGTTFFIDNSGPCAGRPFHEKIRSKK